MTLGRKGLKSGVIKGLIVCCFTNCDVCVLLCKHASMQSNTKQHAGDDRG
ncbi:unnamed protein product [Staurois parvus]|uniref:Uncharacterized protein n=1 Tax=Staurois parvus TaxID=386267 RepID=A0ABN9FRQ4_9NEOB|nr:unnamed protein product [Staurois parvus]